MGGGVVFLGSAIRSNLKSSVTPCRWGPSIYWSFIVLVPPQPRRIGWIVPISSGHSSSLWTMGWGRGPRSLQVYYLSWSPASLILSQLLSQVQCWTQGWLMYRQTLGPSVLTCDPWAAALPAGGCSSLAGPPGLGRDCSFRALEDGRALTACCDTGFQLFFFFFNVVCRNNQSPDLFCLPSKL